MDEGVGPPGGPISTMATGSVRHRSPTVPGTAKRDPQSIFALMLAVLAVRRSIAVE
jgi:hypothetical protein